MKNAIVSAYRVAYRVGEICREVGTLPDMSGVEVEMGNMELAGYDAVDRDSAQFAYECGLCDGYRGCEPMTDAQINIHFD